MLGVVLAGGQARRFGSDKALALFEGETLLDRAVARLAGWCERVVVVGRAHAPVETLADWPRSGMGPLGGLAAALRLAGEGGYAAVLSCGVDAALLPDDLPARLGAAPAYVADQPVIGLWPATAAAALEAILLGPGRHSMKALAAAIGARAVDLPGGSANINTQADLAKLEQRFRRR
ncbi:MAG: molybdenum cofactor guanylyltransferase [Sphingomonadales bacterium]|nr:molybdenum cofactor guanylyltransferase [Sphingomonadales bacterium]